MNSISLKDARVSYSDTGTGEPVLMIHCSSASGNEWRNLCKVLGDRFRTVVPDQWGCGRSDPWTGRGAFRLVDEAEPVLWILDGLDSPVHLVGHSYGGGVALKVARERPGAIRSLTLIEPSVFHLLEPGARKEQVLFEEITRVARAVRDAVATGDYWGGMERFVNYWGGADAWRSMRHDARLRMAQRLPKVVLDFHALFSEPATLADYARLTHPTLLMCGENSPGPSRRIVDLLDSAMPDARIARVPAAGHMSPLTHPGPVNAEIVAHLEANGSRRPVARIQGHLPDRLRGNPAGELAGLAV
ncbi:MAG: alpha/beta hydrolase [Gammaproteobacteria bacterium]|nr:alpha/beta hydrolase [Gammaproteobacteria bacterium]